MSENNFYEIKELPNSNISKQAENLIGFDQRFERIFGNLKLMISQEELSSWENKFYPQKLPLVSYIKEKYPLIIFEGDVGTGKTVMAQAIANSVTQELGKEGYFLQLSTRVRGEGLHGEMGRLVNNAFDRLKQEAGKKRIAFLLIDEADAIATTRGTQQMHQEEKAGVNTLIQKIDEIRELNGRAIIFMSTNRLHFLDEAIIRRAAIVMKFERPNQEERLDLIMKDFNGVNLSEDEIQDIVSLTGKTKNREVGYSFSDFRIKLYPEILAQVFPDKPITYGVIKKAIESVEPSPKID